MCVAHKSSDDSRVFQEGGESLEDDSRPCRPVSTRSKENVNEIRAILVHERRITTGLLAERLAVGTEAARQMWERDLQKGEI